MHALRTNPTYTEKTFTLRSKDGNSKLVRGVYQMVDGGYHRWRVLIAPKKGAEKHTKRWSKQLESVRKDVERTFGAHARVYAHSLA